MLTLDSILKATRQMASYGERGTAGALAHLHDNVEGKKAKTAVSDTRSSGKPARRWDDKLKMFVRD